MLQIAGLIQQAVTDQLVLSDRVSRVLFHGAVHKTRKGYKAHTLEDVDWQEIIEIERKGE